MNSLRMNLPRPSSGLDESFSQTPNSAAGGATAGRIVEALLDHRPLPQAWLLEASVHQSRRSSIYVATFTGPEGGQTWRSTGSTDYDQALRVARRWEREARAQRARMRRSPGNPFQSAAGKALRKGLALMTQREVAKLLNMSERGVREVERRALAKLRNHPALKELWRDHRKPELKETASRFTAAEIRALFDLASSSEELCVIEKVVLLAGVAGTDPARRAAG